MPNIVTLTTDFGLEDHYVGVMKGVILGILPSARIVDISHEVRPYQITEAAFLIGEAHRWFPDKTVHVVVVDPGVGSARRPILVESCGQYFVGPDNGVFGLICARNLHQVRHITNRRYFLSEVSQTFHGRDIFAPTAAHLAKGARPSQVGKIIQDFEELKRAKPSQNGSGKWNGTVLKVDHFGNLVTNFHVSEFPQLRTGPFTLKVGSAKIERIVRCYTECTPGKPALILGSSGYFEIVVNQDSAARILGCQAGAAVDVQVA